MNRLFSILSQLDHTAFVNTDPSCCQMCTFLAIIFYVFLPVYILQKQQCTKKAIMRTEGKGRET